jgi:hypothetical protein
VPRSPLCSFWHKTVIYLNKTPFFHSVLFPVIILDWRFWWISFVLRGKCHSSNLWPKKLSSPPVQTTATCWLLPACLPYWTFPLRSIGIFCCCGTWRYIIGIGTKEGHLVILSWVTWHLRVQSLLFTSFSVFIHAFRLIPRINNNYFSKQYYQTGLCNIAASCLMRKKNLIYVHASNG